jgi:hypothetical protein
MFMGWVACWHRPGPMASAIILPQYECKKSFLITRKHARKRREWVAEHRRKPQSFWERCWFQDECMVELGSGQRRCWRRRHSGEQWLSDFIKEYPPRGVKVMIFLMISGQGTVDLQFPEIDPDSPSGHGVTAFTLRACLEAQLPNSCCRGGEDTMIWDNSSLHTATEMMD